MRTDQLPAITDQAQIAKVMGHDEIGSLGGLTKGALLAFLSGQRITGDFARFDSVDQLNANLNYAANIEGRVTSGPRAQRGVYAKTGAVGAGGWNRLAELPGEPPNWVPLDENENPPALHMDQVNDRYFAGTSTYSGLMTALAALPGSSFARASAGSVWNSAGVLVQAAADVPRFDYDPVTLQPKGLLIEGPRTNLARSSALVGTGSGWTVNGLLMTANYGLAPDGTMAATRVLAPTQTDPGSSAQTLRAIQTNDPGVAVGDQRCFSVYVKPIQPNSRYPVVPPDGAPVQDRDVRLSLAASCLGTAYFNLKTMTVDVGTSANLTCLVVPVGGGWWRCSMAGAAISAGSNSLFIAMTNRTNSQTADPYMDGTEEFWVWGAQNEAGLAPTSYIPTTTTATATRAADLLQLGQNAGGRPVPGWNNDAWTLVMEVEKADYAGGSNLFDGTNAASSNNERQSFTVNASRATQLYARSAGADSGSVSIGNPLFPLNVARVGYRASPDRALRFAGTTSRGFTALTTPTNVEKMLIGRNVGNAAFLNGYVRSFTLFPRGVSDAGLASLVP